MKKLKFYLAVLCMLFCLSPFAQVQVDHPIQLTGSGINAKLTGIQSATNPQDATSVQVVQSSKLIYATATGNSNNFVINITPAITSYDTGMMFNFISNQSVTGPATINVDNLGNVAITKNINQSLGQCDIQSGQMVTVVYDGANFQMTSVSAAAIPTTAVAGPSQVINGVTSTTLAANTPTIGTGLWTIVSGSGGSFSNANSPTSTFTGSAGTTYILNWTITACAFSSSSSDTIAFFAPNSIPGLYVWYDANDASTFSYSSGNSISTWADKSGHGFNASNSTTSEQPALLANNINGLPAVRFTGYTHNTYLANSSFTMNLANRSVFVVVRENDGNECYAGVLSIRGSTYDHSCSNGYAFGDGENGIFTISNNNNGDNSYQLNLYTSNYGSGQCLFPLGIYTDIANSGAGTVYLNGVAGQSGNNPSSTTSLGGFALGVRYDNSDGSMSVGTWQLDGDIGEVIVYDVALTSTQRDEVGAYLSAKWSIPFTP